MKMFFILASFVAMANAAYPEALSNSHYGAPQSFSAQVLQQSYQAAAPLGFQAQGHGQGLSFSAQSPPNDIGQSQEENKIVFKHVFVHVAKDDEPTNQQVRKIKGPGGNEKHVKIIFVKAPAAAAPDQQVVELAQANERKTLVYVLLKKAADAPDVSFENPAPTSASKPEVYFIRYKDGQKPGGAAGGAAGGSGAQYGPPQPQQPAVVPVPVSRNPVPEYGPPTTARSGY